MALLSVILGSAGFGFLLGNRASKKRMDSRCEHNYGGPNDGSGLHSSSFRNRSLSQLPGEAQPILK